MNARPIVFLVLLLAVPALLLSQTCLVSKTGETVLRVEVLNRCDQPYSGLRLRLAAGSPAWLVGKQGPTSDAPAYVGEKVPLRNHPSLSLLLSVSDSTLTAPAVVVLELLSGDRVIGTFPVAMHFTPASTTSGSLRKPLSTEQTSASVEEEVPEAIPAEFALRQNYPNPFNPTTIIDYDLPLAGRVTIRIFDLLGEEIRTLLDGERPAGYHRIVWDGKTNAGKTAGTGVYFYRLTTGNHASTRKMLILH
ncbi:MAG: hypothetical protein COS95_07675 [Ignavibacteriales bacterium CG07_land_8_20_14_0_80_59_12]|nr:MAG: hypothetical protein COS95_07675 [Ignavibacteriales bacterium CG07_land_8_20_14_0_80_59_12]